MDQLLAAAAGQVDRQHGAVGEHSRLAQPQLGGGGQLLADRARAEATVEIEFGARGGGLGAGVGTAPQFRRIAGKRQRGEPAVQAFALGIAQGELLPVHQDLILAYQQGAVRLPHRFPHLDLAWSLALRRLHPRGGDGGEIALLGPGQLPGYLREQELMIGPQQRHRRSGEPERRLRLMGGSDFRQAAGKAGGQRFAIRDAIGGRAQRIGPFGD